MNAYICQFEVIGRSPFPMDMLRYDCCHPVRSDDVAMIMLSLQLSHEDSAYRRDTLADLPDGMYRVRLARVGEKSRAPTDGRWSSFLWAVDRKSITVTKIAA